MSTDDGLAPDALLAALLDAMDNSGLGCTVVINRDGKLHRAYSNAPIAKMMGMTVEELQKTPPLLALTPEEKARLSAMHASGSSPPTLETKLARPDGGVVPVEVTMGTVPIERGQAIVAFLRDLSPRLAMEAALRESEERFRTIAESCPDSITMFSEGRYVYANPVAMKILKVESQAELATLDPIATIAKGRRDEILAHGHRVMAGNVEPPLEIRHEVDGREVFLEASTRLTTFAGKPAIASYSRDITERKQLQARLMQQDRLASVGTVAAGLAHELNNPLTYVSFHLQKLAELGKGRWSKDESETLALIEEGTARMKAVISDLLFLTRASDSPQAHVDLRQILTSTLSLVRAGAKTSSRIEADLAETSNVVAHPSRLGQVFLNVILNALEAVANRDDGLVRVELREGPSTLLVSVADNGVGIPEDVRDRVFDPFFTTKPAGTGLGLSISHAIVTGHGGKIAIESKVMQGTTVTVLLPKPASAPPP